jgi:hypothetical protein
MTQEQFDKILNLTEKIKRYEKILELVDGAKDNHDEGFTYNVRSPLSFDYYCRYAIDDDELNKKFVGLIKEKLDELKREFSDITIM